MKQIALTDGSLVTVDDAATKHFGEFAKLNDLDNKI